jgi:Na+/H+ antiporter NhaD/arsenite permease-like protein
MQHVSALAPTTDAVSQSIVGVTIVLIFALLTIEAAHRVLVVIVAAGALWLVTYLTPYHVLPFDAAWRAIDVNVLLLLAGMMSLVGVIKDTGVFAWGVARLMHLTGGRPYVVLTLLIWLTAVLSAAVDNVTTVIFVTPMAIAIARQSGTPTAAFLLPVVMASNVGGTATLIGDPPNIMIASGAGIHFVAFLLSVAAPVLAMVFIVDLISRRYFRSGYAASGADPHALPTVPPITNPTLLRWVIVIAAAVFAGFATQQWTGMPPAVAAVVGAGAAMAIQDILYLRTRRPTVHERRHGILRIFENDIEWPTLAFFAFLFIVIGAAVETGLIARVASGLAAAIHTGRETFGLGDPGTLLLAAVVICWASATFSAFVDNIPFVAVSIPIVNQLTGELTGDTMVLWWALSLGACLGGNATIVGASANVTVTGLAEREGEGITFRQFARFGVPLTVVTLVVSTVYLATFVFAGARPAYWTMLGLAGGLGVVRVVVGRSRKPDREERIA